MQGALRPFYSELYTVIVERNGIATVHSEWGYPEAAKQAVQLLEEECHGRLPIYIDKVTTERYVK